MVVWTGHAGDYHEFRASYLSKWPRVMNRRDRKRLASVIKRGLAKMRRGVMRQLVRPPSPLQAYESGSDADTAISRFSVEIDSLNVSPAPTVLPDSPATTVLPDSPASTLLPDSPATTLLPDSPASTRYSPSVEDTRQRFTPETSGVELVPDTPPDHYYDD